MRGLSLVVQTARSLTGVKVIFQAPDDPSPSELVFRRSPGSIYGRPYTHARMDGPNVADALEAHVGIYVRGRSTLRHERDVIVLPARTAERCREKQENPDYRKILFAVEATVLAVNRFPFSLARSFMGVVRELRQPATMALVATRPNPDVPLLLRTHHRDHSRFFGEIDADPSARHAREFVEHVRDRLRA
jgi:hypothetical protein